MNRECSGQPASVRIAAGIVAGIALASLPWLAAGAAAQGLIGEWAGPGEGEVSATIRPDPSRPGHFLAEIETVTRRCLGGVEVSGQLGDVAVATAEPDPVGQVCRIELRLVGPDRLRVSEVDNCLAHHGAACGFSGELTRRGVAAPLAPAAPAASPRTAERPPAPAGGRGGTVPWAPGCEFLRLSSDHAPVEVTGVVSPDGNDCYAFAPNAGTDVAIELAEGRNIHFSIVDIVDGVDSHSFRASGYGYTMTVGQLMRSATDEPYRLVFSSEWPHATAASAGSAVAVDVASVQARLAELGYDPGPADGVMGPRTEAAVRAFLDDQGVTRPPGIDAELVRMLDGAR